MLIRPAGSGDANAIWAIMEPIIRARVANCGYMTAVSATGRGVARAMCAHSLDRARERGFRAMQYNFVISTNERAVRLWQSFGFEIVGRLPGAFQHPAQGYVDAYIMYRDL